MALDRLSVTVRLLGDKYEVTAELVETHLLPADIFLYENTGEAELGEYIGVCQIQDLTGRQVFSGAPIDTFGNKYVRYSSMTKLVNSSTDAASAADWVKESVKRLKRQVADYEPETVIVVI